jgi:hypothetical protein
VACDDLRSVLPKTLATPWKLAGGSPAASHFSCFAPSRAPKSNQKKATAKPLPSLRSGPQMSQRSAGWEDKLASLKHVFPQFPADRCLIWQRPNAEFKSNSNVKSNCNPNVKINFKSNSRAFVQPGEVLPIGAAVTCLDNYWAPCARISAFNCSRSSALRSTSGVRTGPPSWPTMVAPALTMLTA